LWGSIGDDRDESQPPLPAALVVKDSAGQKLGYFFYEEGPCRQRLSRNRKEYPLFLPSTQNRTLA
jgi:hypothetical protein